MKYQRLIKNVFAIALIAALFLVVDLKELKTAFLQLTWQSITCLLLISVILIYISALKWSLFVETLAFKVSVIKLFGLYLVGYFINLLLPSYVGGDAVRSFYIGKRVGHYEAFSATILERYTGIVAMVVLALVCMWMSPLVTWQVKVAVVLFAVGVGVVTYLALSPGALKKMGSWPYLGNLAEHLGRIQEGFRQVGKDKHALIRAMALSFVYHMFTVMNVVVAAYALGWQTPPITDLFVVLPLILLIGSLPVSPSGLGIQEGAYYYFLQGVGATPAQAFGVGLLLRAKSYVLAIFGGIIWLCLREAGGDIGQKELEKGNGIKAPNGGPVDSIIQ